MGKIISGVTDALGLTDTSGAQQAANIARDANANANALSKEQIALMKEQLDFQKSQYQDWKDIYGDLQTNLGDYYKNLNSDDIIAMKLQNQQREYQAAVKQMETEAAQRGITNSGLEYAAKSNATFQNAETRAAIRSTAKDEVVNKQLGFLGIGLGQGTQMLGQINNAGQNVNTAYGTGIQHNTNTMNSFLKQQTEFGLSNMDFMRQMAGAAMGYMTG